MPTDPVRDNLVTRSDVRSVRCPECSAPSGGHCRGRRKARVSNHAERVDAYLLRLATGDDPRADARRQALDFVAAYNGDFPFMLDMRAKAAQPAWTPTTRQMEAILRCKRRDELSRSR